jgi:hypothetical protein
MGPFEFALDTTNGILYNSCWQSGVWALKIEDYHSTRAKKELTARRQAVRATPGRMIAGLNGPEAPANTQAFSITGRRIGMRKPGRQVVVFESGR